MDQFTVIARLSHLLTADIGFCLFRHDRVRNEPARPPDPGGWNKIRPDIQYFSVCFTVSPPQP